MTPDTAPLLLGQAQPAAVNAHTAVADSANAAAAEGARGEGLRARVRALLACQRSSREAVGRRPAVFRRPVKAGLKMAGCGSSLGLALGGKQGVCGLLLLLLAEAMPAARLAYDDAAAAAAAAPDPGEGVRRGWLRSRKTPARGPDFCGSVCGPDPQKNSKGAEVGAAEITLKDDEHANQH